MSSSIRGSADVRALVETGKCDKCKSTIRGSADVRALVETGKCDKCKSTIRGSADVRALVETGKCDKCKSTIRGSADVRALVETGKCYKCSLPSEDRRTCNPVENGKYEKYSPPSEMISRRTISGGNWQVRQVQSSIRDDQQTREEIVEVTPAQYGVSDKRRPRYKPHCTVSLSRLPAPLFHASLGNFINSLSPTRPIISHTATGDCRYYGSGATSAFSTLSVPAVLLLMAFS
ncbi:hypothetical protein J6590_065025 [Homalodisca vitripennis]|nr:hypothetical protein J6590_065025 [Homalodisca vitripennis]